MTIFEFAIYRCAARVMRPDQRDRARALAQQAEAGDQDARWLLKELCVYVVHEAYKQERYAKKVL